MEQWIKHYYISLHIPRSLQSYVMQSAITRMAIIIIYFLKIFRILKRKGLLEEFDARISKMNAQNQHVKTQYFFLDDAARFVQDRMTVSIKHFVSCYGIRKHYHKNNL